MSQLTTHILDTTLGKPAQGVAIHLEQKTETGWLAIANGITNNDGRIADLLSKEKIMEVGVYRMHFDTATYFNLQNIKAFYLLSVKISCRIKYHSINSCIKYFYFRE